MTSSAVASPIFSAAKVVDGLTSTCMLTKSVIKPWLTIDLGTTFTVEYVKIANR